MFSAALNAMGNSEGLNKKMDKFMEAAMELQNELPQGANLHCFITCPLRTSATESSESSLFPLVSRLFHSALHASRRGSAVAGQALRDAFLIAHRVSHEHGYYAPRAEEISLAQPQSEGLLSFPDWFPAGHSEANESSNLVSANPQYIFCRHDVMTDIGSLGIHKIADIYTDLFTALWEKGRTNGEVTGRLTYSRMTPPWLRHNVIFIHGQNRNASLPYTLRVLPKKKQIKDKNFKFIGRAILDTILRREESMAPYLRRLLREAGCNITDEHIENATPRRNADLHPRIIPEGPAPNTPVALPSPESCAHTNTTSPHPNQ